MIVGDIMNNPAINIPGKMRIETMTEKKQFPKMVYLSNKPTDYVIIKTQEEMPEGAKEHWLDFDKEPAEDDA